MLLLGRLWLRHIVPTGFLGIVTWLVIMAPGLALELRVAVQQNLSQVKVASSTPANIFDSNRRLIANLQVLQGTAIATGSSVSLGRMSGARLWIEPTQGGQVQVEERWYRGRLELIGTGKGLVAVNHIELEEYLPSVVGKEMYPSWPLESLKAQAVAARTFALFRRNRELRRGTSLFDLGDSVLFQAYPGVETETASTIAAVQATQGQVLTHNGQLIEAVFHSASGGHTENSEQVWSGAVPYLRGVPDFDQGAPVYQWTIQLTAAQLRQRVPGVGNILAIQPTQISPRGRIRQVQVIGDAGTRTMTGAQVRSALGLRSTLFTIQPELPLVASQTNPPIPPSSFLIFGRGNGHGLGLSQWGALGMANLGYTYDQILTYYYQGVTISQMRN